MIIVKLIFKVLALPVILALTLIVWIGIFLTSFSSVILNIISGLFFLVAVASWLMGISTGAEAIRMLGAGFLVFILPHLAEWILTGIASVRGLLLQFIGS